jgi:undecaprenyl-diphosphatase
MRKRTAFAVLVAAAALASSSAQADDSPRLADQHFTVDPVTDIVLSAGGAGVAGLMGLILTTGEIQPTQPGSRNNLLSFDRVAVDQTIDPNAATYSNVILWSSVGFAALDPILSGLRDGWDAGLVDAVLYAESLSLTEALTNITKVAVRRPRPIDYITCENKQNMNQSCLGNTDLQLSFFSGHASTVAAVSATATYLAFVRSPHSPRPWITLAVGTALTAFVSYERVRSGQHFPTDVIAGAGAGAAVGILVPHLHRRPEERPTVWIGAAPAPGGGILSLQGLF